ncbi:EAL domain-containing protein [Myxococcota bacterium]|nr:EAL domain-containing protein [Myxococcota bacterium]
MTENKRPSTPQIAHYEKLAGLLSAYTMEFHRKGAEIGLLWFKDHRHQKSIEAGERAHDPDRILRWVYEKERPLVEGFLRDLPIGSRSCLDFRAYLRDRALCWMRLFTQTEPHPTDADAVLIYGVLQDITLEQEKLEQLRKEQQLFRLVTEHASDMVALHYVDGRFRYVSPSCERLLGFAPSELIGVNLYDVLFHPEDRVMIQRSHEQVLQGQKVTLMSRSRLREGGYKWFETTLSPILDQEDQVVGLQSISRNVTKRKEAEEKLQYSLERLEHLAQHDALTGLPNRLLFQDRLRQAILQAAQTGQMVAVLCFDLDRFQRINDTFSHSAGDQLLLSVAERLKETIRQDESISRLGGDEFAVMIPSLKEPQAAVRSAQMLLRSLEEPFEKDGHELFLTASIGISFYPIDGEDFQALLKNAYSAMYEAKEQGKNTFHLYTPALNVAAFERLALENSLRRAIERGQFELYYQPQVKVVNEIPVNFLVQQTLHATPASTHYRIAGMEALLRWKHPDLGLVSPARFIPIAEDMGLIVAIGEWVLQEACRQCKVWQAEGFPRLMVSVNISPWHFLRANFVEVVSRTLEQTGFDPSLLELEITENIFLQDEEATRQKMRALHAMGVHIAIDDFGTGYSSLLYLKRFPVQILKVDQSFIKDLTDKPEDSAITKGIVALAHSLGLTVVAEGVHNRSQLNYLRSIQCDRLQGYLFSPPLPAHEFAVLMKNQPLIPKDFVG